MKPETVIFQLERSVVSTNTRLKEAVKDMDAIILLRNVHPSYRSDFAYLCKDARLIHPSEITEFIYKPTLRKTLYG